jgi:DNA polymerase-3 subunit alpha (Gram-positive type)
LPFSTVEGAGANAAAALRAARDDGGGAFLSVDDFKRRAKASSTIMTALENMGAFEDIPKSTQLNLFDF